MLSGANALTRIYSARHSRGASAARYCMRMVDAILWRFARHDKIVRAWWIREAAAEQIPHRRCLAFARQRDSGWQLAGVGW
jgi:hypothetical protein